MSTTYNAFTCILNTNTSTICMVILCIYHYIEYIVLNTLCVYVDIYIYISLYAKTRSAPLECEQCDGREHIPCDTTHSLCGIEHCSVCAVCTQYAEHAVFMTYMRVFAQNVYMCCAKKLAHTNTQRRTHPRTHIHTRTEESQA